ncbi:leucyl aminopeptidase [Phaeospirillum tilakii]|uniref:Probable cytosol aminopeptidase n=1 Tax=Phaeospirillum tilakii TaxID=741673 RepID=A0ABW5CGD0_9PROT
MKIAFSKPSHPTAGALVVAVAEGGQLPPAAQALDAATQGGLGRAIAAGRFEGKANQTLTLLAPAGLEVSRLLLVGIGKAKSFDALAAQALGGNAVAALLSAGDAEAAVIIDTVPGVTLDAAEIAAHAAFGARRRAYRFDKYRTKEKKEDKPTLKKLSFQVEPPAEAKTAYARLEAVAEAIDFTRDLVTEPANVITPETLAEQAKTLAALGVEIEVLDEKAMRKLGMGALLGVGQGSEHESRLVVMRWQGAADPKAAPVAFIGKGVTFDSGGISIKPSAGMEEMKWDMAGAATVIGTLRALAARKARVNAVGVVGLVENMPSGSAQRPGDVVTSMSGQTIEVINTDAEGRLVLADALWYTQDRFKPKFMVDLATLTGAIVISLGHEYAGLFASDDRLAERLTAAGKAVGEPLWRLPLGEAYDKQIKSDIADMKNVGGREGGSITAAQFLKRFTNEVAWAHLDIAGTAWSKKDTATCPKGATAFGVALLDRLVADHYEDKGSK